MRRRFLAVGLAAAAIVALCGAGLVYSNDRSSRLVSSNAVVISSSYVAGTPFAGAAQTVSVQNGDRVEAGQELLRLQSATLEQARQTARFSSEGVGYRMEGEDVMVFTATHEGIVRNVAVAAGSFVPANTEMATIDRTDSLALQGTFALSAHDYSRMGIGSEVTVGLPDSTTVTAQVSDVQFGEEGEAEIHAHSDALRGKGYFTSGAPVDAVLHLEDDGGIGAWVARQLKNLVTPNGFAQ